MADISSKLDKIKSAERGEDVRDAIIGALRDINNDVPADMSNPERVTADMPGGSDLTIPFNPPKLVSEIYVRQAGSGGKSTTLKDITIIENGEYPTDEEDYDSSTENRYYKKVKVKVPQLANQIEMDEVVIEQNGTYSATEWGVDGLRTITVNVQSAAGDGPFQVEFYDKVVTDPTAAVIGTQLVAKGGSAEYTGQYPTSPLGPFTGWDPSPVNITRDMKCYPKFGQIIIDPTEITDDWTVICQKRGVGYPLGSHKLLAYGATFTPDEIKVLKPSYDGDSVAYNIYMMMYKVGEGEGNSLSSWLSSTVSMSPIPYENNVPWMNQGTSGLRNFLNGPFYNHMSDIFKNSITSVQKYSLNEAGVAIPTQDRIWVPGTSEIGTYQTRNDNDQEYDFAGGSWSGTYVNYINTLDAVSKKYVRDYLNNDRNFVMAFLKGYNGTVYYDQPVSLRDAKSGRSDISMIYNQSSFYNAIRYGDAWYYTRFNLGFCL